jgi:Rrf2 family transcriptional regulator, cysteine metabolism repressor
VNLSKSTEYAVRAMIRLTRLGPGEFAQARDIARVEQLPGKFLEAVLLRLKKFGYLESKVGAGGGYRLARPARQVRIDQLLDDMEADDDTPTGDRESVGAAGVEAIRSRLRKARLAAMQGLTLESLAEESAQHRPRDQMYYI